MMPKYLYVILAVLVISQGTFVYYDAKKRKEKYPVLWGIFGSLNVPSNLIVYLIVTRLIIDKYKKKKEE